jgi:hypothetical protein
MSAKIDGGHVTALLQTGKPVRIFSYRPAKNETGLIEHTHRVQKALRTIVPKGMGETVLRGELYARDRSGEHPLPSQVIGGMMNANVWLSREKQKEQGSLRFAPFDVVKWRGRDFSDATYAKKLEVLQEIKRQIPWMELPDMARTPEQKIKLLRDIKQKRHPQTQEGVVFWELDSEKPPVKAKVTSDHDVIIKGFVPGKGELDGKGIGAIQYGDPKHPKEVKGLVGTGMSSSLRQDMHKRPSLYINKVMKLKAQGVFPSGALRSPRFLSMHLDSLTGSEKVAVTPEWVGARVLSGMRKRTVGIGLEKGLQKIPEDFAKSIAISAEHRLRVSGRQSTLGHLRRAQEYFPKKDPGARLKADLAHPPSYWLAKLTPENLQRELKKQAGKVSASWISLEKTAIVKHRQHLQRLVGSTDNIYRLIQKIKIRQKSEAQEKKAALEAQGPSGFLDSPHSSLPTTSMDAQGKLMTNEAIGNTTESKTLETPKMLKGEQLTALRKKQRIRRPLASLLATTEDPNSGDYKGPEPAGVDRGFKANSENHTPSDPYHV